MLKLTFSLAVSLLSLQVLSYANHHSGSSTFDHLKSKLKYTSLNLSASDTIKKFGCDSLQIEQIIVTGQYKPQSLEKSVYHVRTISQEQIKTRAATNMQQLLSTQAGIRFSSDLTLGISDIELMGMSGRNVKILLDGYPMLDRSDSRESLNQIDVNIIDRIEIVEGPMSVLYGSDALAGVINIITKNPTKTRYHITAKFQEETVGKEYNFGDGKGTHHKSLGFDWNKNKFYGNINASSNNFGGWNTPSKSAFLEEVNATQNLWKPKEQYLGNIRLGFQHNNIHVWYRALGVREDINSRYGINPNTYIGILQTYRTNRIQHQLGNHWLINEKFNLDLSASYTDLQRQTITTKHDYNTSTSELTSGKGEQDIAKFNSLFLRPTLQHYLSEDINLQYGIELNKENGSGARIKGSPSIVDFAGFISAEYAANEFIKIRPGVRYIKNSVYDAPKFVPALNLKVDFNKSMDVRFSYAKGYRAPALRELYFDFIDASHSIIGNENLRAETSNSWNGILTWRKKSSKLHQKVTFSSFYNVFQDRIDYGIDATNSSITTLLNIDKYKTTGFSIEDNIQLSNIKTTIGFSYIGRYNRLSESTSQVKEFSWTPEIYGDINYSFTKYNGSINLYIKHSGKRPSYQLIGSDINTAQLVKLDGMTMADLMLNKSFLKNITLQLGVKNLFNVTNLNSTREVSSGAHSSSNGVNTSYGRSFVMGLTYNWTKQ